MKSVIRAGNDAFVQSDKPKKSFGKQSRLRVGYVPAVADNPSVPGDQSKPARRYESYLLLKNPAPRNATVLEATLILEQSGAVSGSRTIKVQPAASKWRADRIRWNSKPASSGPVTTLTKSNTSSSTQWEFDVTEAVQSWTNGAANFGFRIWLDGNDAPVVFNSMNAAKERPRLMVRWTTRPEAPTLLKPSYGFVAAPKPTLMCDFTDYSGATNLIAMQVQIDTNGVFASGSPGFWDSGQVNVTEPTINLANTSFPGLADGQTMKWRCRVKDGDGLWSLWSDTVTLKRAAHPVVTITNPAPAASVILREFTPTITWTVSKPQTHFRVTVSLATRPNDLLHDSGKIADSDTEYTLPLGILERGVRYRVVVYAWDNIDREDTPGSPVYAWAPREFNLLFDPAIEPVPFLNVGTEEDTPWVDLTFGVTEAAHSYTITRDGKAIAADVYEGDLPAGPTVNGTRSMVFRDWTARPEIDHVYAVHPQIDDRLGADAPQVRFTPRAVGIWIADPATGRVALLGGRDVVDTAQDDNAETFTVYGSSDIVRSVMGLGGLTGVLNGAMLRTRDGFTWLELEETLMDFKSRPAAVFRLVFGDLNIPVILGDIRVVPHPQTLSGRVIKAVYCKWWQKGEHPFEVTF